MNRCSIKDEYNSDRKKAINLALKKFGNIEEWMKTYKIMKLKNDDFLEILEFIYDVGYNVAYQEFKKEK